MKRKADAAFVALVIALLVGGPWAYYRYQSTHYRNFREVTPGVLYRCGQLTPDGLARVIHDYGIRTVITLRDADGPGSDTEWERDLCSKHAVVHVQIPAREWWSEKGPAPAWKPVRRFLQVLRQPDKYPRPILIHCFAGKHRTGAFCAIYRMECEGWSPERALNEMRECGYTNLDNEWDVRTFLQLYQNHSQCPSATQQARRTDDE